MPYYKDALGDVHYLDDVRYRDLLPTHVVEISSEEAEALRLPGLAAVQAAALAKIDEERAQRAVAAVFYAGAPFDADSLARERISGLILRLLRGDGLPVNWIGWRGADNAMHWAGLDADAVRVQISGLSSAIEDREQALLIAAWQLKAAVLALDDAAAVQGYDISAGWPA